MEARGLPNVHFFEYPQVVARRLAAARPPGAPFSCEERGHRLCAPLRAQLREQPMGLLEPLSVAARIRAEAREARPLDVDLGLEGDRSGRTHEAGGSIQ